MMPNLTYPSWANSREKKTEYCGRLTGKLRDTHNIIGAWYRDGITQATYDSLPVKAKNRYAFTDGAKLLLADWKDFIGFYSTLEKLVLNERNRLRALVEEDGTLDVDIDRDIS